MISAALAPRSGLITVLFDDLNCYHVIDTSGSGGRTHGIHEFNREWVEKLLEEIKSEPLPQMRPSEQVTLHAMEITDAAFIKRRKG